ncbi:MAG: hypothetical protein JWM04_1342 [Verrucomicrobiales bacterium]|nr:hypothetical protein [Verrucomicrobiales bacterium]
MASGFLRAFPLVLGMVSNGYDWAIDFKEIYQNALKEYLRGSRELVTLFPAKATSFLASIGCSQREVFDFVEDFARDGEPEFEIVLLVTAVRRDFFIVEQGAKIVSGPIDMGSLPPKSQQLEGIRWLPRIIAKAKAKLRGEMPPELMYLCGGDRPFLRDHGIDAAEFLRRVWAAGDDTQEVVDFVKLSQSQLNKR